MSNIMEVKFSAKSENESLARVIAASFAAKLDPTLDEIADIKTAAINVLSNSEDVIKIDFYNFKDLIMRTPMSKDSKEYKAFEKIYSSYNN